MAKLYIEGDKSLGLKKHFNPIYKDARSDFKFKVKLAVGDIRVT
jgi:hypothetical protein